MKEFPFKHGDEFFVEGGRSWVRSHHPRFM